MEINPQGRIASFGVVGGGWADGLSFAEQSETTSKIILVLLLRLDIVYAQLRLFFSLNWFNIPFKIT